jgi:hypothetical protein
MGRYSFDIMENAGGGDYSLVLTEYSAGAHGPLLGSTFLSPDEIDRVFDKLIEDVNAARQRALDLKIWRPRKDSEPS